MKTICNSVSEEHRVYPYLGRFPSGTVVLFVKRRTGTCVHKCGGNKLGDYDECWAEEETSVFNGTVTLSND